MPYQVYKTTRDGKTEYCLYKKVDNKKGELVPGGCHDAPEQARKHQAALYASENKEIDPFDMVIIEEDGEEKEVSMPELPAGVATSFEELYAQREYRDRTMKLDEVMGDFQSLVGNIIYTPESLLEQDKVKALSGLFNEFKDIVDTTLNEPMEHGAETVKQQNKEGDLLQKVKTFIKELFDTREKETERFLTVWKEADGSYSWLTTYSNKFIDDDNPPDVIASVAHKKFVEEVDKEVYPLPELWLWHVPEWKIGYATALAYDDVGFPVAIGKFDKECNDIAEWLETQEDFGVSHGMWKKSLKRDPEDESVIVEYQTYEISPLPHKNAANKLSDWYMFLSKEKEDSMTIPAAKREELLKRGLPEDRLNALEERNKAKAAKAESEGLKSKEEAEASIEHPASEAQPVPETDTPTEGEHVETPAETPSPPATDTSEFPTRKEVADAIATVLGPTIGELKESISGLQGKIVELEDSNAKVKELLSVTPRDSLATLMAQRLVERSSKSNDTVVPRGDKLLDMRPKQTKAEKAGVGIRFIDRMTAPKETTEE